jgi:hypothetical protein
VAGVLGEIDGGRGSALLKAVEQMEDEEDERFVRRAEVLGFERSLAEDAA